MADYTPYQERIRDCFAKAYRFADEHKHPRTEADFSAIIDDMANFGSDPFLSGLLVEVVAELEREYADYENKTGIPNAQLSTPAEASAATASALLSTETSIARVAGPAQDKILESD